MPVNEPETAVVLVAFKTTFVTEFAGSVQAGKTTFEKVTFKLSTLKPSSEPNEFLSCQRIQKVAPFAILKPVTEEEINVWLLVAFPSLAFNAPVESGVIK